ncbi:hypothetical protein JCM10914A_37330 [Paenibacillus sp. JCM 10914]|nr:hypothetical protein JCM10914_464 [Paenibacillus sp. JCM 10914]
MMGRVRHEILYVQAAEVFGRFCEGDLKYVSQELTACPGATKPPPGTAAALPAPGKLGKNTPISAR